MNIAQWIDVGRDDVAVDDTGAVTGVLRIFDDESYMRKRKAVIEQNKTLTLYRQSLAYQSNGKDVS